MKNFSYDCGVCFLKTHEARIVKKTNVVNQKKSALIKDFVFVGRVYKMRKNHGHR